MNWHDLVPAEFELCKNIKLYKCCDKSGNFKVKVKKDKPIHGSNNDNRRS